MVTLDNKNVNCPHESQVPLDVLFEDAISPLPSEDDLSAELPYVNSTGFNQLEFVSNMDDSLVSFE